LRARVHQETTSKKGHRKIGDEGLVNKASSDHNVNTNLDGKFISSNEKIWLSALYVKVDSEPLNRKNRDLHKYGVILQIWGEGTSLSKFHKYIHAHWYGTLSSSVVIKYLCFDYGFCRCKK
jgi:hypothetical protein